MTEHWMICLTQLAITYAGRLASGPPLSEYEVCCYMQICRLLENNARYLASRLREQDETQEDV